MGTVSLTGLAAALSLLTRVPMTTRHGEEAFDPGRAVPWLPLVSAAIGGFIALIYGLLSTVLPESLAATAAIGTAILSTGAFHEDGLADFFDAVGGARTVQERLSISADPRLGTFGVLALIIALLARVGAVAALDPWDAAVLLTVGGAVGQAGAVLLMRRVPPAKSEGLAATYSAAVTPGRVGAAVVVAVVIVVFLVGPWTIIAMAMGGLVAMIFGSVAKARFNGITGDVLGATQQVTEIVILLLGVVLVHQGYGAPAWWRT